MIPGISFLLLTGCRPASATTCTFTVPSIRSFLPGTKVGRLRALRAVPSVPVRAGALLRGSPPTAADRLGEQRKNAQPAHANDHLTALCGQLACGLAQGRRSCRAPTFGP